MLAFSGLTRAEDSETTTATVITAEDIRREHPATLTDLLRNRAGVDDSSGTITMRGVPGVAVILNGSPSSLFDLNQLSQDSIESIEIIHGAASARFGANAMGGAIVVKTQRGAVRPTLSLTGSSTGSVGANFWGGLDLDSWRLGMTLNDDHERGYPFTPVAPYPGQITVEAAHSRAKLATLNANYQNGSDKFGLEAKWIDTTSQAGRPNSWAQTDSTIGTITAGKKVTSNFELEMRLSRDVGDSLALQDAGTGIDAAGLAPNLYSAGSSSSSSAELDAAWRGESTGLRAGTIYQRAAGRSSTRPYNSTIENFVLESTTLNRALFAHFDQRIGSEVEVGLDERYDRYEYPEIFVFDSQNTTSTSPAGLTKQSTNPKLEIRWHATKDVGFRASIGTGFVPPDPFQLYASSMTPAAWFLANPDLRPERSQSEDIGVNVQHGEAWSASATLFHTRWEDKIGVVILNYGIPFTQQYANIGEVESSGVEVESRLQIIEPWSATLNYTYNHSVITRDQTNPEWLGNTPSNTPRHRLNAALAYESGDLSGQLRMRTISSAFSDDANTVTDAQGYRWEKGAYTVFDAVLVRRFNEMDLTMSIDNMFNRRYTTGFFYLGAPRLIRIESKWRF